MPDMYDASVQQGIELGDGDATDNTDVNGALRVNRGTNKMSGTLTLNGTSAVTVANSRVTANSIILLGGNAPAGTPAAAYVATVTPGTGFTVKSAASDTSVIGYVLIEPTA